MILQRSMNKGISYKLTKREFFMLALLILVLEGFLLGKYVVLPAWEEFSRLKEVNDAKFVVVERLKADFGKMETYKKELEVLKQEKVQLKASIPSYISQEEALLLLDKNSKDALMQINLIGFETMTVMQSEAFITKSDKKDDAQTKGTEVLLEEKDIEALKSPLVVSQTITLSFAGGYNSVYSFIESLEKNLRKVYVKNISLSSADTSILSGSLSLEFLSFVDAENYQQYIMDIPEMPGKTNPFASYSGYGQDSKKVETEVEVIVDPNFYILLNSYLDNAQKIIMGEYPKADTEIYSNKNAETTGKLVITGDDKSFGYSMTLGTVTRNSTQNVSVVNGTIRLKIVSLARKDAKDLVGMVLDIENKTGVPVEVQVLFDDAKKPRIKKGNLSGNVTFK